MKKVITYGTYDLLHYGHIRLLERAKALGDYLVVGVTAEDFDKVRGKINGRQSLMERIEAVKATGLADEIIVEEYEGQKIDDIKRLGIDIFTVGSDWEGYFDYLKEYCDVVYLDRTQGVSSTELRSKQGYLRLGIVGNVPMAYKVMRETAFVNGLAITSVFTKADDIKALAQEREVELCESYEQLLERVDAVYIASRPQERFERVKMALEQGKHVLCEAPIALSLKDYDCLANLAREKGLVLMDELKTAYSTAFHRLKLLVKSGRVGEVVSIEANCTSLFGDTYDESPKSSFLEWGPYALLPIFQILGLEYAERRFTVKWNDRECIADGFTKADYLYSGATASLKVGNSIKTEGDLIVSGTKGYIYVPAPWWKTDYFELRFEDPALNKRYFYQLDGEGIRYELVNFMKSIESTGKNIYLESETARAFVAEIEAFRSQDCTVHLN